MNWQAVKHEGLAAPTPIDVISPVLPINLDTVLRLAEEQNRQLALARARLSDSETERQLADSAWLPQVFAGVGYFRHEGAIQNQDGTITRSSFGSLFPGLDVNSELDIKEATFRRVEASRKVWQQKAEVTKVTYDTLLDAASTYIDLLAARRGETVAEEIGKYQDDLLTRAEKLNTDGSLKFLVESLMAEISGRKQAVAKLHQQGDAASLKLAYLLGLPRCRQLIPTDRTFAPIDLVDASPCVDALVDRAITSGPGIHEMEGLLNTITAVALRTWKVRRNTCRSFNLMQSKAISVAIPVEAHLGQSLRPGTTGQVESDELYRPPEAAAGAQQTGSSAFLLTEDLQAKLTLGVEEVRDAILNGQQQIVASGDMVKHASETYRLSDLRLKGRRQAVASPK